MKRLLVAACAPATLLIAACTGGPAAEPPEGDMHCGSIDGEVGDFYWDSNHPTGCFLLRFEDENDRGTFVDDTHAGPTRVHWYLPLPFPRQADSTSGGGDCLASGVDADGATNGWTVTMDDGHCNLPGFDVQGHENTARMHTLQGSTLSLVDGVWQRRGAMWAYDYYFNSADPLDSTGDFTFPLGMRMDGVAEAADIGWPLERFGGECAVDGCYAASQWTAEILEGDTMPNCIDEADAILAGIGTQQYDVAGNGHRLWWESDSAWRHLVKTPDGCTFARNTSNNWTSALDFDAGEIAATFRGNVYRQDGTPQQQWCVLRFRAPLVDSTDCAGQPHPG